MIKRIITTSILLSALALPVSAAQPTTLSLPAKAVEVSHGVFSLGRSYDMDSHRLVEGYAIVHKKEGQAKGSAARAPKAPKCYAVMADGAKWKSLENWEVYPGAGLSGAFLLANLTGDIAAWETAAVNNVLGNGSLGAGVVTDPYTLDNVNQVSFGDLDTGTIAVTIVWGTFSGPTFNRQLVAWDQIYNTDYQWSEDATLEPTKMDFANIATHELGHAMGLADIYNAGCSDVTMYGYGTEGETQKRDLAPADISGINLLY